MVADEVVPDCPVLFDLGLDFVLASYSLPVPNQQIAVASPEFGMQPGGKGLESTSPQSRTPSTLDPKRTRASGIEQYANAS